MFGRLPVAEIQQRLRELSQTRLALIEDYERAHARRIAVLDAIKHLRVREAESRAGHGAEGALRAASEATHRTERDVRGAAAREEDLPIIGYSRLGVTEVHQRLRRLSQADLAVIENYERTHAHRPAVLDALQRLRGPEPWAGYDTMDLDEITERLDQVPSSAARRVLAYERRHLRRQRVLSAAETRIPG